MPSFVKSRTLHPFKMHFLFFQQQIFFVLVCIHPGNAGMSPRVNPPGANTCTFFALFYNLVFFSYSRRIDFVSKNEAIMISIIAIDLKLRKN